MLVGCLIVVEFILMFLSSKNDTPADTPTPQRPFSQPDSLGQQLLTPDPNLGKEVQAASVGM